VNPPADVVSFAREAMFRRFRQLIGGEVPPGEAVALLVYDSAVDPESRAGIRGARVARHLTFEAPGLVLEVQVEGPEHELTCQVVPPQPASLEILHEGGVLDLGHDDCGVFYAPSLPVDAFSLRLLPISPDPPTVTSWISVFERSLD
jgi:hypothetical protein